jgi:hypothetical protein
MFARLSETVHKWMGWCPNAPAIRTAPAVHVVPPDHIHPAQPGGSGPAGNPGRIRDGISIATGSLKAMFRDRQLLRFTFLSGLVMLFMILAEEWNITHLHYIGSSFFSIPIGGTWISFDTRFFWIGINFGDTIFFVDLPLFLIDTICLFCFSTLLAGLIQYRAENRAQQLVTMRRIFHNVRTHATTLAALSVTMALFGSLLDMIIFQTLFLGKTISAIEMAVFNLPYAYYLQGEPIYVALLSSFEIMFINSVLFLVALYVVPVVILEKEGLVSSLTASFRLMRKTWRELLGCVVIYGAIVLGIAAIALVIGQSPYLLNHDFDFFINMSRGQLMMMTVCFLFLTMCWVMTAAGFTAAGIALTDLYGCGKTGHVGGGNNSHPKMTAPVKDQSADESRSDILNR